MVSTTTLLVMVYFVVEGINDGGVKRKKARHLPSPFRERFD